MTTQTQQPVPFCKALYRMIAEHPDVIRWDSATGSLIIPNPKKLEKTLLEYFRHGRYASFQRQLNNFGYRRVGSPGNATVYRRELSAAELSRGVVAPESILSLRHVLRRSQPSQQPRLPIHPVVFPVAQRFFYPPPFSAAAPPKSFHPYHFGGYDDDAYWPSGVPPVVKPAPPAPARKPTSPNPHVAAHALLSLKQQMLSA
mmetsp:Transcript_18932/g.58356  ORF Transcript_18932/g.58356 Transcript_18932/m.58356 type:complete len:201 (-) Transcript_18932:91-693(-)